MRAKIERRNRAFTLYEILAVLVMIGIATGIVVPQLGSNDAIRVKTAARMLVSDLLYARSEAVNHVRKYYVQFGGVAYLLQTRDTDTDPLAAISHPTRAGAYKISLDGGATRGVKIASLDLRGNSTLVFNELGSPYVYDNSTEMLTPLTTTGQVRLQCGDNTMDIFIEPWSGEISVTEN